ncbi:LOW QUALITY PROTEIN: small RNA 2'-O-methyltransferase [Lucilia sericata]|uniref:LOW QUALITY PROTEIN: small RNA 2'-O-methyltransferase n=1 Tax=Lucilia sericata TaxID=13632 RepID=UPI0018A86B4A|nr:LOW QUALITY PROTEIN: small RNA 2'-O-methyltransferase [Lucilia sericata]
MFSYNLPNGGLKTKTYKTPEGQIKFDPPVYEQRYTTAVRIIEDPHWKQPLKKIVDFGCAELRLLTLLRRIPHVEHILEVDIDAELLKVHQQKAIPLISDYLKKRENPLRVEVLQGSVTDSVEQLYDVDAVIALELIEHLHPEVLDKVPENIFGFIQPKLAIFSTPNSEYNVLFGPMLENGFRHYDHKFEWTRQEFQSWAHEICKMYTNYSVSFMGVGKPPPEVKKLGHATQIAIFARNDMLDKPLNYDIVQKPATTETQYKVIYSVDFPYNKDERPKEQKILDEANFYVNQSKNVPKYFNRERCIYQVPWKNLMEYTQSVGGTETELLEILERNKFKIEDDFIILPEYDDDDDEENASDDLDYDGEYNLEAQPYKCKLNEEEEDELSANLASGCNLIAGKVNYDSEEDWD